MACPVFAIDIDQINKDFHLQTGIEPIQTETAEPVHEYNFWKGQFDPWTKEDTYWQIVVTSSNIIDWGQTRTIALNPDKYYENNSIISKQPSVDEVDNYFIAMILFDIGTAYILPKKWRRITQIGTLCNQLYYINNNYQLRIGISF